jgi:O-antigen/teichoic acid export membrane protein
MMFSVGQKYALATLGLLTTAVLARLLTPAEMGVFLVGRALVIIVESLRDFGITNYLIQARTITTERVRTAFTVTLISSVALSVLLYAFGGEIAGYYGESGLRPVLHLAAVQILFLPFSATVLALLRRDMAFDAIAWISTVAAIAYSVAAIGLAAVGFSYMSLAWASLVNAVITTAAAVLHRRDLRIFWFSTHDWRQVFSFGGVSYATSLLNSLAANAPQLILGRVLGSGAVGIFTRACMLSQLFDRMVIDGLSPVMLPAFSGKVRDGHDLKGAYLRAIESVTALHWPFLLCLALLADPIVDIVLGPQWLEVAPLLRIVAMASMCLFPAFLTYPVLVATGRIGDTLIASLITIPASLIVMIVASFAGLYAAAASLFISLPIQVGVALMFVHRQIPFSLRELLGALKKSAMVAACAATAPAITILVCGRFDLSLLQACAAGLGAALGWVVALSVVKHPLLGEMREVLSAGRALTRRGAMRILGQNEMRFATPGEGPSRATRKMGGSGS